MDEKRIIAVAFDDTLVYTSEQSENAYRKACLKCGLRYPEHLHLHDGDGVAEQDIIRLIEGGEEKAKSLLTYKNRFYLSSYKDLRLNEELIAVLSSRSSEEKAYIVTSERKPIVRDILNTFHIRGLFDGLITREDAANQKPAPGCYLLLAKIENIPTGRIFVCDNGQNGSKAALFAGCKLCTVSDLKRKIGRNE